MKKTLFLAIVLLSFISCENDKLDSTNEDIMQVVIAGAYDSNFSHKIITPDFYLKLHQVGCWELEGADSIDISSDGIIEFYFKEGELNSTPMESCCPQPEDTNIIVDCWPSFYPYYYVSTHDSIEVMAETVNENYVFLDALNDGDTISIKGNWYSGKQIYFYTYNKSDIGGYGKWINIKGSKYLGFRISQNGIKKYGWIRIDFDDKFIFKEVAFEN